MRVEVGYSEYPDTETAGTRALKRALKRAGRNDPNLILLFATAAHDPHVLHSVIAHAVGPSAAIVGGAALGAITNDRFGYDGEQVGLAAVWLEGAGYELFTEGDLAGGEERVGARLGKRLAGRGIGRGVPSLLLYDAVNRAYGDMRLNLATPLLHGLEKALGFIPDNMVGAGLQGDLDASPTLQWIGDRVEGQQAILMTFSGGIRIDSVIMHGCRPIGDPYTVTKAEGQTILEVNGRPAIPFIETALQPTLPAEEFPFFMIFGVNRNPGGEYDERNYANRLCLGIDRERNGITMFESDMVPGTRFQIMYRSLDLEYIPPKIEQLFRNLGNRRPVFALYIDCAGRAARGLGDMEDAVVVQESVRDRVPLLGIYSGVEIAPIMGRPRTLDWTGVFCLFSEP